MLVRHREERVATKVDPLQLAVVAHSRQKGLHLKISDHIGVVYVLNIKKIFGPCLWMTRLPVGLRDRCSIYLPHPICYKSYEVIMEGIDRRMGKWSYHLTIVELGRKTC